MQSDVAIIGAGPGGLCLAKMLAQQGLQVVLIEQQPADAIATPAFDGRDIALSQHSMHLLQQTGVWQHVSAAAISPLLDAKVFNGPSLYAMHIDGQRHGLGTLVANHVIRRAAFQAVASEPLIQRWCGRKLTAIEHLPGRTVLTLDNGQSLKSCLLVAADSRYSETRRLLGIATHMHDFGRSMLVCVMQHPASHQHTAWEWFDYGRTLALLPMNGNQSSVVITMPVQQIATLMTLSDYAFNQQVTAMFQARLGAMVLASTRHVYPLVTTSPERLVAPRFALAADAAIGMHPLTAHGFNFGLLGAAQLAALLAEAIQHGVDIASPALLHRYELAHQRATRPLFLVTHLLAKLYSNDALPAKLVRNVLLRAGNLPPVRYAIANTLRR